MHIFKHFFGKGGRQPFFIDVGSILEVIVCDFGSEKQQNKHPKHMLKKHEKLGYGAMQEGPMKFRWGGVPYKDSIHAGRFPWHWYYTLLQFQLVLRGTVADTLLAFDYNPICGIM